MLLPLPRIILPVDTLPIGPTSQSESKNERPGWTSNTSSRSSLLRTLHPQFEDMTKRLLYCLTWAVFCGQATASCIKSDWTWRTWSKQHGPHGTAPCPLTQKYNLGGRKRRGKKSGINQKISRQTSPNQRPRKSKSNITVPSDTENESVISPQNSRSLRNPN